MEVWSQGKSFEDLVENEVIEPPQSNGILGYQGWHIPKFSLEKDPSLVSYFGLMGEENREKLANTFGRPLTWGDYCNLVSSTNCSVADSVAKRPPVDGEHGRYFFEGSYIGHFRLTDKNNCAMNPNCTGHFLDYPCGWTSFVKQQTHHLNIALESNGNEESGGYSYSEMVEIWNAANATKSDIIGLWWKPDAVATELKGSGFELAQVLMPGNTRECHHNRIDILKRCDPTATEFDLYGDGKGACGETSYSLSKIASVQLQLNIKENRNKKAQMSPAYEVYRDFSISEFEVEDLLSKWLLRRKDKYNFDLRYVSCEWVTENLEHIIQNFVPPSHPKIFLTSKSPVTVVAYIFSIAAIMLALGTMTGIFYQHHKGIIIRGTQLEFLQFLLAGLLLTSIGSFLLVLEPSKGTCVGSIWFINVGYTLQLVPMIVRVSTIINVVRASSKMRLVIVNKQKLLCRSFGISAIMVVYCLFWTIFDPPQSQLSMQVTDTANEFGESEVYISNHCDSKSKVWYFVCFFCQFLLLLCGSVLAGQMQSVPRSVNDSKLLAFMMYTSAVFLLVRTGIYAMSLQETDRNNAFQKARSICCSLDTVANILVYFSRFFLETTQTNTQEPPKGSVQYYANRINQGSILQEGLSWIFRSQKRLRQPETEDDVKMQSSSHIFVEEEKQEEYENETSAMMRFMSKDRSVDLPKWVFDKYASEVKQGRSDAS